MCLVLLAVQHHKEWPLIIAANRDEFVDRPTAPADFWEEMPDILAGRDLKAGGTWMGIHKKTLRFAAITNFRDPKRKKETAPSRGHLVEGYLKGEDGAEHYLGGIAEKGGDYNGFNLICGTPEELWYYSNTEGIIRKITPGVHGLSNAHFNTPWPKVTTGCERLSAAVNRPVVRQEDLITLLSDQTLAPDEALPDTGMGLTWERILAPVFIEHPVYATRSSTALLVGANGEIRFTETQFLRENGKRTEKTNCFRL